MVARLEGTCATATIIISSLLLSQQLAAASVLSPAAAARVVPSSKQKLHEESSKTPWVGRGPYGIHLALGSEPNSMLVQWVTAASAPDSMDRVNSEVGADGKRENMGGEATGSDSYVRYARLPDGMTTKDRTTLEKLLATASNVVPTIEHLPFVYRRQHHLIAHGALMRKLRPSTHYVYQVGSGKAEGAVWSQPYVFRSLTPNPSADGGGGGDRLHQNGSHQPHLVLAVFGDLGLKHGWTLPLIIAGAKKHRFDAIVHVGDIGYDLVDVGVEFLGAIEEAAARVPYMVVPGNHDWTALSYPIYSSLFRMPNCPDNSSQYYSFSPTSHVHLVGVNTELYYPYGHPLSKSSPPSKHSAAVQQLKWLDGDLAAAKRRSKKKAHLSRWQRGAQEEASLPPWIFVFQHRPFYCSDANSTRCPLDGVSILRHGIPKLVDGLEPLFHRHRVDAVFTGHQHFYERFNLSESPLPHPLYMITGAAGNSHRMDDFNKHPTKGSMVRSRRPSYTRVTVWDERKLILEQVAVVAKKKDGGEKKEAIIDSFMVIRK